MAQAGRLLSELRLTSSYQPEKIPAQVAAKSCSRCKVEKPLDSFSRQKAGRHGRRADCKRCQKAYNDAWRADNKDRIAQTTHEHYLANREAKLAYNKAWNRTHRKACDRAVREFRARNPEATAAQKRAWRLANPDLVRAHKRAEYVRHSEAVKMRVAAWRKAHPDKHRANGLTRNARKRGAAGADYTTAAHIEARWAMFGGRCYYCGGDATCTDHRIPLARGGSHWPSNLVPCCVTCNSRKHARTEKQFKEVIAPTPPCPSFA